MDLPFRTNIDIKYSSTKSKHESNVFPRETNLIAEVGFPPKKYLVKCDGKGQMSFDIIEDPIKKIEKLSELMKKKAITEEEYETRKKKLLDDI